MYGFLDKKKKHVTTQDRAKLRDISSHQFKKVAKIYMWVCRSSFGLDFSLLFSVLLENICRWWLAGGQDLSLFFVL